MPSDKIKIFLDQNIVPANQKMMRSLEPGILKGRGAFETFPCHNRRPVALGEHLKRLAQGLRVLKIQNPHRDDCYAKIIQRLLAVNYWKDARVRIAVWENQGKGRVAVVCQKLSQHKLRQLGMRAIQSKARRSPGKYSHIKSMDYAVFRRAYDTAKRMGFDEAILLNRKGNVVEGSRSNIFFIKGKRLYTPSLKEGCLAGITRKFVLNHAKNLGLKAQEISFIFQDLMEADEAFLTNSIMGVCPLIEVNCLPIHRGQPGPVTRKLTQWYQSFQKKI